MKIGIDISQIAYEKTGVAIFLKNLVENLIKYDKKNNYVLFYSSLRKNIKNQILKIKSSPNVTIRQFKIPPAVLDILWNKLHIAPIEWFIGDIDVFITSDWTEPPTKKAKKATILYDLVVYKYPKETDLKIVNTQKRKLKWVKKESSKIFCISNSTAEDAENILNIGKDRLSVIYPGT
ncbi:MAG: hypothetical protein COX78_00035 [Candidatus Levybacteria bacterium CG_4_10_14_0_2_um_filter_35_8]|nr:MAG: hypothetical protein COX78_00035 [Candidatus Levybacteria bacterium CG_4_10_14_0_2_um_filter_35_8]